MFFAAITSEILKILLWEIFMGILRIMQNFLTIKSAINFIIKLQTWWATCAEIKNLKSQIFLLLSYKECLSLSSKPRDNYLTFSLFFPLSPSKVYASSVLLYLVTQFKFCCSETMFFYLSFVSMFLLHWLIRKFYDSAV